MNRLNLIELGGMPFNQARLKFLQDSIEASISALAKGYNKNPTGYDGVVINGCVLVDAGLNVTITAGAVYFNDELWIVPAATVVKPAEVWQIWRIEPELVDDPVGILNYFDGLPHPTQKIRTGKLVAVGYASLATYTAALPTVAADNFLLKTTVSGDASDWSSVYRIESCIHGEWIEMKVEYSSAIWLGLGGNIYYKRDMAGNVTVTGHKIAGASSPVNGHIATLPVGFRPLAQQAIGYGISLLRFDTNGEMRCAASDLSNTFPLYGGFSITFKA